MSDLQAVAQKYTDLVKQQQYPAKPALPVRVLGENFEDYGKRKDAALVEFRQQLIEYRKLVRALEGAFMAEVLYELGLKDHPRADLLMSMAWEHGRSSGFGEVASYAKDLSRLLK